MSVNPTVTSTMSPSGTFAVMTPIAKIKLSSAGYPTAKPNPKRTTPMATAKMVSRIMNRLISSLRGGY